ncbi:hypothetical protein AVEN_132692-1 [Araneus ventricosus]|uniref:DDE-1 domain-containing protein n=1 Tax=Araneus ventricosus TaxID=182803 RepID=A0A4Y2AUS2_ARAVE|nr:hypothetical protein AVEN_132692-1 [Araneus ventricosus]
MRICKIKTDGSTTPQETFLEAAAIVMTGCSLRNAAGKYGINFMAPQRYCSEMKIASDGSSGSSNKSGWMTGQDFQSFMRHFITRHQPVLLILDSHQSHLDLTTLDLVKDNRVILLSFQIIICKKCNSDTDHDDNSSE